MKKVMFVVVMLLVATSCFAQLQGPPSNVAGYVKVTALANSFTPFGLPFKFWVVPGGGIPTYGSESTDPEHIVGDQSNCGNGVTADLIWRQDNGNTAFRTCAGLWSGTLHDADGMIPGRAYWYRNRTVANRNLVLAGEVDNSGNYGTVSVTNNAYTPVSWRNSRSDTVAVLNLLTSGFTGGSLSANSDQVIRQGGGGSFAWYRTTGTPMWQGSLGRIEPGLAYWVFNRNHVNGTWVYNFNPGGALLTNDELPTQRDNSAPVSKISTGPVKSVKSAGSTRQ